MHKISFEKFASLVYDVKPNELVAPLVEHLAFVQSQMLYMQALQAMSDARIDALEKELATLKEILVPHGLGGK